MVKDMVGGEWKGIHSPVHEAVCHGAPSHWGLHSTLSLSYRTGRCQH